MFVDGSLENHERETSPEPLDAAAVTAWADTLIGAGPGLDDAGRIDLIAALERLKAAAAAAQARASVDFEASQRSVQEQAGMRPEKVGLGIASQIALARKESAHRGGRLLGLAKALVGEMPHTMAALEDGRTNEWRATLIARETACLSREDRAAVDAQLWADPERIEGRGDRAVAALARSLGYRLDPVAVTNRAARAESERCVTLRPAPDTMTLLTGALPVAQGVAAFAALQGAAEAARAAGDPRSRGQIMADTLVERVTGRATAVDVPVQVNLVMSDTALLDGGHDPAHVLGYGPVPAGVARRLAAHADQIGAAAVRRLFVAPGSGNLVALESRGRNFRGGLADFIDLRDQSCRTPWCDAPIRHHDHVTADADGGITTAENGQGLCEACNYAKQAPGWDARPEPQEGIVDTTTPTGHRYTSVEPYLAGRPPPSPLLQLIRARHRLVDYVHAYGVDSRVA